MTNTQPQVFKKNATNIKKIVEVETNIRRNVNLSTHQVKNLNLNIKNGTINNIGEETLILHKYNYRGWNPHILYPFLILSTSW